MLRYKTKTRPGLVALYDVWPGNGAGPFLQPRSPHGALGYRNIINCSLDYVQSFHTDFTISFRVIYKQTDTDENKTSLA